jgi:hypothetical protein
MEPNPKEQAKKANLYGDALIYAFDQPAENIAETLGLLGFKNSEKFFEDLVEAPEDYEAAFEKFLNSQDEGVIDFDFDYLPRSTVEQVGQLAGSLAARGAGMALGGGIGAGVGLLGGPFAGITVPAAASAGAFVGGFAGPFLFEAAQVAGPVALARARANGRAEPNWQDWAGATGTATVSGLFNMFGIRGVGELNKSVYRTVSSPIRAGAREGITEGFQGLTEQIGSTALTDQGLEIDPKAAIAEGIVGGTTGGAAQAPVALANFPAALALDTDLQERVAPIEEKVEKRIKKVIEDFTPEEVEARRVLSEDEDALIRRFSGMPTDIKETENLEDIQRGNDALDAAFKRAQSVFTLKDKKTVLDSLESIANIRQPQYNPEVLAKVLDTYTDRAQMSLLTYPDQADTIKQRYDNHLGGGETPVDSPRLDILATNIIKREHNNILLGNNIEPYVQEAMDEAASRLNLNPENTTKLKGVFASVRNKTSKYMDDHITEFRAKTPSERIQLTLDILREYVEEAAQRLSREQTSTNSPGRYDTAITGTAEPRNVLELAEQEPLKVVQPERSDLDKVMGVPEGQVYLRDPLTMSHSSVQPRLARLEDGIEYDPQGILSLLTTVQEIPESVSKKQRGKLKNDEQAQVAKAKVEAEDMGIVKLLKERQKLNQKITKTEIDELIKDFFARFEAKRYDITQEREYGASMSTDERASLVRNPRDALPNNSIRMGIRGPIFGTREFQFEFIPRLPSEHEQAIRNIESAEEFDQYVYDNNLREYFETKNKPGHPKGVYWGRDAYRLIYEPTDGEPNQIDTATESDRELGISLSVNENQSDLLQAKKQALGRSDETSIAGLTKEQIEENVVGITNRPFSEANRYIAEHEEKVFEAGINNQALSGDTILYSILKKAGIPKKIGDVMDVVERGFGSVGQTVSPFGIKPIHSLLQQYVTKGDLITEGDLNFEVTYPVNKIYQAVSDDPYPTVLLGDLVEADAMADREVVNRLIEEEFKNERPRINRLEAAKEIIEKALEEGFRPMPSTYERTPRPNDRLSLRQQAYYTDILNIINTDLDMGPRTKKEIKDKTEEAIKESKTNKYTIKSHNLLNYHNFKGDRRYNEYKTTQRMARNAKEELDTFIIALERHQRSMTEKSLSDVEINYKRMKDNEYLDDITATSLEDYIAGVTETDAEGFNIIDRLTNDQTVYSTAQLKQDHGIVENLLESYDAGRTAPGSDSILKFKQGIYDNVTNYPRREAKVLSDELIKNLPEDVVNFYRTSPVFEQSYDVASVQDLLDQYENINDVDVDKFNKAMATGGQSARHGIRTRVMDLLKAYPGSMEPEMTVTDFIDIPNKETNIAYGQGSMVGSYEIMQNELRALAKRLGVEGDLKEITYNIPLRDRVSNEDILNSYQSAVRRAERDGMRVKEISNDEVLRRADKGLALDIRRLRETEHDKNELRRLR